MILLSISCVCAVDNNKSGNNKRDSPRILCSDVVDGKLEHVDNLGHHLFGDEEVPNGIASTLNLYKNNI